MSDTENLATQVEEEVKEVEQAPESNETRDIVARELDKLEAKEAETKEPEAVVKESLTTETEAKEEVEPARNPFSSWKKEAQAALSTLDPNIQKMIVDREAQFHKGLEQYKGAANAFKTIAPVIERNKEYLDYLQVSPEVAFDKLLQTERLLRTGQPEQKAQMFLKMAHDYGIDLSNLAQTSFDPDKHRLESELNALKQQFQSVSQSRQMAEEAQLGQTIQGFAQQHEYFEDVRETMADLLDRGLANDLEDAYAKAVRLNDDVFNKVYSQQNNNVNNQVQRADQAAKAAKAAAVSVKGSPTGVTRAPEPKSTEEAVRQAMAALGL